MIDEHTYDATDAAIRSAFEAGRVKGLEDAVRVAEQVAGGFILFSDEDTPYIDKRSALETARLLRNLIQSSRGGAEK